MSPIRTALLLCASQLLVGCGTTVTTATEPTPADPTSVGTGDGVRRAPVVAWDGDGGAPPITVLVKGRAEPSPAWAWCSDKGCADGSPDQDRVPDAGTQPTLAFSFPDTGWDFEATLHSDLATATPDQGPECDRTVTAQVQSTGPNTFTVQPAGPAGRWRLDVFGRGPEGGDVIASVLWTTPVDGPIDSPSATLGVLAEHDGRLDSYGVELNLVHLSRTPEQLTAAITVTDAAGAVARLPEIIETPGPCGSGAVGTVFVRRPDGFADAALELGPGPYRYDVELILDGVAHRASASFPGDQVPGGEPAVALTFDPPLE